MPGKEARRQAGGPRRWLRQLVLAAMLAIVGSLLVIGPASADGWPHQDPTTSSHGHHH